MTWSANFVTISTNVVNQGPTFEIIETGLYIPVVTLSTQDNAKLLSQLKLINENQNQLEQSVGINIYQSLNY